MSLARMPSSRGRRLVDRCDHLDEAFLHRDLDADPAELALGLHLHLPELVRAHVARVRVERGEHAVDGALDQLRFVRWLDVVGAHLLEHVAKEPELPVGRGRGRVRARQDNRLRHERCQASAPARVPRENRSRRFMPGSSFKALNLGDRPVRCKEASSAHLSTGLRQSWRTVHLGVGLRG